MARNRPNISLIIPAYNEERRLAACLDSVFSQTRPFDEVVVVDNGSTDATAAVARRYAGVRVLTEPKRGRVFAREAGFAAAHGTILARIDADTVLPSDWTAKIEGFYTLSGNTQAAWTGGAHFYNVRLPQAVSWLYNRLVFGFNRLLIGHPTLWGSNMALPVELWRAVRADICQRNDVHEDLDLAIHLHRRGYVIHYQRRARVRVQMRRVRSERHELWEYLLMWPRTLRVHGIKSWPVCWFFGAFLLYLITPLLNLAEYAARFFGKKPLKD
jgi:glycosyltransferase involved in cell wall biosynthesis